MLSLVGHIPAVLISWVDLVFKRVIQCVLRWLINLIYHLVFLLLREQSILLLIIKGVISSLMTLFLEVRWTDLRDNALLFDAQSRILLYILLLAVHYYSYRRCMVILHEVSILDKLTIELRIVHGLLV